MVDQMYAFEEDYAACLGQYLREARGVNTEGLRDDLYQAYVRMRTGDPGQLRKGNELIEHAVWGPCPYSGLPAVQLLTACGEGLGPFARDKLLRFLAEGRDGWKAELEKHKYNSFRLLAAVSLLGCGVLLGDGEAAALGGAAIAEMEAQTEAWGLPDEFLSPFYTALQLAALSEAQALPGNESSRASAARLERLIWRGVLRHYQPGLLELAGPYSRGYTSELAGHFQAILACIRRLLRDEAGFAFRDTLWNPGYASAIVPHGSLEGMRLYALYFAGFSYQCAEEDLRDCRERTLPCAFTERVHTDASRDVSIKAEAEAATPYDYPAGEIALTTQLEDGFALAWSDREYENGMACPCLQVLYRKEGATKAFFPKLVRDDRYIGEWNDYPNLGLRLSECNFPDDGRKSIVYDGRKSISSEDGALRLSYRPRALCRGAETMKLDLIFASHFSLPDEVWVGDGRVEAFDGTGHYALAPVTVRDAGREFVFTPLGTAGYWKFTERNRFLNLEWVQDAADFDALAWELRFETRKWCHAGG